MNIEGISVYQGPSVWAYFPVIRVRLDLGLLESWPSGRLGTAFQQGLLRALPGLREHGCSYGVSGGFVRRLTEGDGTWLGHVMEHSALELQNLGGFPVSFGRARGVPGRPGVYDVVYQFREREVGLAAGRLALTLLYSLLPETLREGFTPPLPDYAAEREGFLELARRKTLGPSTAALAQAAQQRRIPWERLDGDHLIQLGTGVYQCRVQGSITSRTSQIGVEIAQDKALTNRVLDALGIPVPAQVRVDDEDEAVAAAARLGWPVVVKPVDGNHGRGVEPGVSTAAEVRTAYHAASQEGGGVLVEEHLEGRDYRLLVVNGSVVAAAQRVPAQVVGDGISAIEALVERVNADPRRGEGHANVLTRIELDEEADRMLARAGHRRDSVPARGEVVPLRATANLSRGGTSVDVTDRVHPDNRLLAVRAALAVGLDVAGVDFLCPDITRSYLEVGGGVCELNAAPGLRMHVAPAAGTPRDVAGPIMDYLYPPGSATTIPIAAITGTNGKTTTARMVAHLAAAAHRRVGLATTDGVYVGGRRIARGDMTGPASARMLLRDATVDCAVLETARGGILREGLGFRHCSVGAVLNVTADHLGLGGIDTVEGLADVKRIVVEVAGNLAVLNADDPLCLVMAESTEARICLVSLDPMNPAIVRHLQSGGLAVVLEDGNDPSLVVCEGARRTPLLPARRIPATLDGKIRFNIQNAAFAAAIGLGLGLDVGTIRGGLATFEASITHTPGRVNLYDKHPFRVLVDYGHNPAAVRAMCEVAGKLAGTGRTICVLAVPGDRRDEDIREVARVAAGWCDYYICRRDDQLRGRRPDEVPLLLCEGLRSAGVPAERISVVPSEADATLTALGTARPGDLLLLFADNLERTWQQVVTFQPEVQPVVSRGRFSTPAVARREQALA